MLSKLKQPTKEQIRQYMDHRKAERTPPPALEEIRKRVGWIGGDNDRAGLAMDIALAGHPQPC
ncbi:MAG: hypothetical protein ACREX0_13835 [Noviherbaspirillum sp.]